MSSESFLSRWSRRKQEVHEAEQPDRPAPPDPTKPEGTPEPVASNIDTAGASSEEGELSPEEIARLPSLEDLTAETDLTAFLRKGVPEVLRKAALRRMWSLDPKIRDYVSEAREYAYDWNTPGGVPGSGVLPPSEEISRMAARIVGGGATSEPEQTEVAQSQLWEQPSSPDQPPAPVAEPASQTDAAPTSIAKASVSGVAALSSSSENERDAGAVAPRADPEEAAGVSSARRHGGAMPL